MSVLDTALRAGLDAWRAGTSSPPTPATAEHEHAAAVADEEDAHAADSGLARPALCFAAGLLGGVGGVIYLARRGR